MTSLYQITFTIGQKTKEKFHKVQQKAGTSIEDAFGKLCLDYRRAEKALVLIGYVVLATYPESTPWTDDDRIAGQQYLDECEVLRQRALLQEDYTGLPGGELL